MNTSIIAEINSLTHEQLARLWRFAPSEHIYFSEQYFGSLKERFKKFGGMTTEISKKIGWEKDE